MKIFILDDDEARHQSLIRRYPGHWFVRAYTADEAIKKLSEGPFDLAFFDHYLGDWYKEQCEDGGEILCERTGLDVVEFLLTHVPREKWPEDIVVHTWNKTRGQLMTALLVEKGASAIYQPFTP